MPIRAGGIARNKHPGGWRAILAGALVAQTCWALPRPASAQSGQDCADHKAWCASIGGTHNNDCSNPVCTPPGGSQTGSGSSASDKAALDAGYELGQSIRRSIERNAAAKAERLRLEQEQARAAMLERKRQAAEEARRKKTRDAEIVDRLTNPKAGTLGLKGTESSSTGLRLKTGDTPGTRASESAESWCKLHVPLKPLPSIMDVGGQDAARMEIYRERLTAWRSRCAASGVPDPDPVILETAAATAPSGSTEVPGNASGQVRSAPTATATASSAPPTAPEAKADSAAVASDLSELASVRSSSAGAPTDHVETDEGESGAAGSGFDDRGPLKSRVSQAPSAVGAVPGAPASPEPTPPPVKDTARTPESKRSVSASAVASPRAVAAISRPKDTLGIADVRQKTEEPASEAKARPAFSLCDMNEEIAEAKGAVEWEKNWAKKHWQQRSNVDELKRHVVALEEEQARCAKIPKGRIVFPEAVVAKATECAMKELDAAASSLGAAGASFADDLAADVRAARAALPDDPPETLTAFFGARSEFQKLKNVTPKEQQLVANMSLRRTPSGGVTISLAFSVNRDAGGGKKPMEQQSLFLIGPTGTVLGVDASREVTRCFEKK